MKPSTAWGLFAVIAFLAIICSTDDDADEAPYRPSEVDAYIMAKKLIEPQLKAPSTAEFASYSESLVTNLLSDEWKVTSYVDSQNAFGAMIRTRFTIVMRVDRDTKYWQAISLETEP